MKKLVLSFLIIYAMCVTAQTTTVSATVVDSTSSVWANGSWSLTFFPNPNNPNINVYNINGVPLSTSVLNQSGTLDGAGHFSFSGYQTGLINPSGALLQLSVCPNATAPCGSYLFSTGTNSTLNISAALTAAIPVPKFKPVSGTYGYNDAEAVIQLLPGSTYWNVTTGAQRCYTGSVWGACALATGAGTGACPSNQYEIADTSGGPTCAQVAYSQITGTPPTPAATGSCPSGQYEVTDTITGPTCAQVQYSQLGGSPVAASVTINLTGDISGSGTGTSTINIATTLPNVNSGAGTCGDGTHVCQIQSNAKGQVTNTSAVAITFPTVPAWVSGTNGWAEIYTCTINGISHGCVTESVNTPALNNNTTTTVTLPMAISNTVISCVCSDNGGRVQSGNDQAVGCNLAGQSAPFSTIQVNTPATGMTAYCHVRGYN